MMSNKTVTEVAKGIRLSRDMKVQVMVDKAIDEGYEFLNNGVGSYDQELASKRNEGYDVRCWYTSITKSGKEWVMYGKKKESKRSSQSKLVAPVKTAEEIRAELESNNVKSLREMCKSYLIKGYAKMNKEQMINAIMNGMK